MQPSVGGIVWVNCRELLRLFGEGLGFGQSSLLPPFVGLGHQRKVSSVLLAFLAAGRGWDECAFDVFVQFIHVQITQEGAHNRALWRTTERGVIVPVLQISGLEYGLDES